MKNIDFIKNNMYLFIIIFAFITIYIYTNYYFTQDTKNKSIEVAEQCVEFYQQNHKLPTLIMGKENEMLYDNEHILILFHGALNTQSAVVINYLRNDKSLNSEIWDFVDLFPDQTKTIKMVNYIYGDNLLILTR